jgi:hypothetical protein
MIFSLLAGCADAGTFVKENYPLIDVQGKGKSTAKIYVAEGKTVPEAAKEIADADKPQEISKESTEQMFLVYSDKIINIHKDPNNENNSLIEWDTVEYAKEHYDSSFLQGYITASLLQSLFGGGWFNSRSPYDYRGYNPPPKYNNPVNNTGNVQRPQPTPSANSPSTPPPSTSERKGSFGSKPSTGSTSSSSNMKRNDGSTPNYKTSGVGSQKPTTGKRSGSFSKRR